MRFALSPEIHAAVHALGLRPRERGVLLNALATRYAQLGGGNFLVSPGSTRSGERLIERGFVTRVPVKFSPPVPWLVVTVSDDNLAAMNRVLDAARRRAGAGEA